MEIHIKIIGLMFIALGCSHVLFPYLFQWKKDLGNLLLINKQLMYVHTFFIALMLILIGVLCFASASALLETVLGRQICIGLSIFWLMRLGIQLFGFSSVLWKGKTKEKVIHYMFIMLWSYCTSVFIFAAFYQ